jgi:gamma-glutamyltranspeptidase/glutathione hydrolase
MRRVNHERVNKIAGRLGFGVTTGLALAFMIGTAGALQAASQPVRARFGMVVSQNERASRIGAEILGQGGNAVDAAVATAFVMAVTHPTAGNIGGGGFLVFRPASGEAVCYDFRETAPALAVPTMFLRDGKYDPELHHNSHLSVGVPGSVAGLYLAWKDQGKTPWSKLVEPAMILARDGFPVTEDLAQSLREVLPEMRKSPAAFRQFSRDGIPYEPSQILRQPDLARTFERIARKGPKDFYEGETAQLITQEMKTSGGLVSLLDLKRYRAQKRSPLVGNYRGYEVTSIPPSSSGGTTLIEMLNILEGIDLTINGFGSAANLHLMVEAMRRAYADRARYLGDSEFNDNLPIARLTSKEYAAELRESIRKDQASRSSPDSFTWPPESLETTHVSVVDAERNAVALTTTLENGYGSRIVVPGAGFLLNNEMGDFNAAPGLTTPEGLIGTPPNLAAAGKRMLSNMTPTILLRNGKLFMVTGSPGGRTIINTVLQTILNVVDFGMNIQEAVDAPRIHHQWLPNVLSFERFGFSPDTLALLEARGHVLKSVDRQGVVEAILYNSKEDLLEGASDRRAPDGAAVGVSARPSALQ